jgi:Cu(I)/Ag(I) efflux system protein CusF
MAVQTTNTKTFNAFNHALSAFTFIFYSQPVRKLMKTLHTALLISTMLLGTAYAQTASKPAADAMKMDGGQKDKPAGFAATDMTDAEVRKVDKDTKKITLKHGDIKNLDMPGMTMVFQVKDPAMLDKIQAGDKVRFKAEKANGAIVVTEIQPAK